MADGATHLHATAVALGKRAALLRGASGSGKSDLAFRFLTLPQESLLALGGDPHALPRLVSDDQTQLTIEDGKLIARAPATIRGKLEVRGVGLIKVAHVEQAEIVCVVDLVRLESIERMPEPAHMAVLGLNVPKFLLTPFEVSAALKLALMLVKS
jgi:serine kinase of HPr protein (carbohydrate metabolism regulator)